MALNCGGWPPDPPPGYLLIRKGSEMASMPNKLPIESTQQAATTAMFGSGSGCNYVGSKSNDDCKGVVYDSYDGGTCRNSIIGLAAAVKMGVDHSHHIRHYEMECVPVQLQNMQGVDQGVQQQLATAGGYAHPASVTPPDIAQIGSTAVQLQVRDQCRRSPHDMMLSSTLQLQGKSAASQPLSGANSCRNTKGLVGSELPQPATGTDNPRMFHDMSLKMTVQQQHDVDLPHHHHPILLGDSSGRITAVEAERMRTQGGVDHHHNERPEDNTAAARGKLQYMRLSPDGSSMMSMEEQEGVYYGGSKAVGVGGDMQMGTWEHYNLHAQEGQSMMMMLKKRRLTNEQVKSLEVSFERESKLEAERKKELAQELGLQPRQVAVWFQNRRARFKTKQLERDFDLLKHQYDAVRSEKDKLLAQVAKLKGLLDAQSASSKGTLLTPAHDTQGKHDMDKDQKVQHLSPESSEKQKPIEEATEGTRKQNAIASRTGKQKAIIIQKSYKHQQQHGEPSDVLSNENLDQTHVRATILGMDQPPKSLAKSSFTLEVKPSLRVPHVDQYYYHHHQQQFSNTLSPPTKLSLCSPQQLFLHHMVAMKMEGDNFNPQDEPHSNVNYNDRYNFHHNHDEGDGSDSMLCFNSTCHHDP